MKDCLEKQRMILRGLNLHYQKAKELNCIIVLKGHHTFIATTDGKGFFNTTGNPGMATAGSGDVLTGILTGLLAQGYSSVETAILGVYLHGLAGDIAAKELSMEAMIAGDIISNLCGCFFLFKTLILKARLRVWAIPFLPLSLPSVKPL